MNILKLYRVKIDYIKYLYEYDNRVQYNPNREERYTQNRPYLGTVLQVNGFSYFVPLEHPRKQHKNMKNNIYIYKIHNGKYGILGFNNMIPIKETELIEFDINKEESQYRQILISQYHFCNKHIKEIIEKATDTYNAYTSNKNQFLKKVCCNFQLLEKKAEIYNRK